MKLRRLNDMNPSIIIAALASVFALAAITQIQAELSLNTVEKAPPDSLGDSIKGVLDNKVVQLLDGDRPIFEFWFRTPLAIKSKPASIDKSLAALEQPTLIGAAKIHEDLRDYRDDDLYGGVHTMRFGLQPEDGNHLGTSEFRYFAVLIPTKLDQELDGVATYKRLSKLSSQETSSEHPMILSLRPVKKSGDSLPSLHEPAPDHKSIRISLAGMTADGAEANLVFDLVYEGMGEF